jgi:hypothetical protein
VDDDGSWCEAFCDAIDFVGWRAGPAEWLGVLGSTDQESAGLDKQNHFKSSKFEVFDI